MIKTLFLGRKKVAAKCLRYLVSTNKFNIIGIVTDNNSNESATAKFAHKYKIPLLEINSVESQINNGTLKFELAISVLFWKRIKHNYFFDLKYGAINFHPAPLPEFKGVGGYNFGILENLNFWEVTAHFMDKKLDNGDIIASKKIKIDPLEETALSLEGKSQIALLNLFKHIISYFLKDEIKLPRKKNGTGRVITRKQMESMKKINPKIDDIERKIRAFWFPPYDGAYIEINGKKFTLVSENILKNLSKKDVSAVFKKQKF